MTIAHPEIPARTPIHGPGTQLAQARADQRLTHEEVAAKLHLATRQIQALEQDDYTSLPGATYVRGYLKSYALLLGLPPAPILEAHARLTAAPTAPDFSAIAPQREITSRHHQVRFVTYFMAAIVIGLAIAWWQGRDTRPPNPLLATHDTGPAVPAADAVPSGVVLAEPEKDSVETPASPAPTANVVTASKPPVAQTPAGPTTTVAVPAATPPPSAATPVAAALPAGPRIHVVLYAEQDSWADIRDARHVKLLYDTVPAGRTLTLEGVAPLSIFLGNAAGVRLEYNGNNVDVGRHQRGMMARFTLGEEEAAAVPAR
jgi:cytoskeleton protein RodZ